MHLSQVNPIYDVSVVRLVNKRSLPKRRRSRGRARVSTIDPAVKHALRRREINFRVWNCVWKGYILPRPGGARVNPLFCFVLFNSLERVESRELESRRARPFYHLARSATCPDHPYTSERQSVYGISRMHGGSRARACGSCDINNSTKRARARARSGGFRLLGVINI